MIKFVLASSAALALATAAPALAQVLADQYRHNQNGSSTFDSIDPTRTDPGSARDRYEPAPHRRHSASNGRALEKAATLTPAPMIHLRLTRRKEKVVDSLTLQRGWRSTLLDVSRTSIAVTCQR